MNVVNGSTWIPRLLTGDVMGSSAGPSIVRAVREDAVLRYKPFVLRCPECSAPTPEGVAKCRYCDVPLRWEAVHSLSRDDRNWRPDEEETADPDVVPLGFGPTEVGCLSRMTFHRSVQLPSRPTHLYVPPNLADHFSIVDVRIGKDSQGFQNPVPASWYSTGRGSPVACDTATPGILVGLIVENKTACNRSFEAVLRCKTFRLESLKPLAHSIDSFDSTKLRPWDIAPDLYRAGTR